MTQKCPKLERQTWSRDCVDIWPPGEVPCVPGDGGAAEGERGVGAGEVPPKEVRSIPHTFRKLFRCLVSTSKLLGPFKAKNSFTTIFYSFKDLDEEEADHGFDHSA